MAEIKRSKKFEEIDRLSLLPDAILIHIMSLLPIKSAVTTSVLSHQWRYHWTHITNIVFSSTCLPHPTHDNSAADYRILPQLTSTKIHRFYLFLWSEWKEFSNIESWMHDICCRNPEQVVLESTRFNENDITLPSCILQCQSLVEIKIIGDVSIKPLDKGFVMILPKLRKLQLSGFNCHQLAEILRCCPLLEDLSLSTNKFRMIEQIVDLSTHNLKKLVIKWDEPTLLQPKFVINLSKLEEITLQAPGLMLVRFVGSIGALKKADIRLGYGPLKEEDFRNGGTSLAWNDVVLLLRCCPCLEVFHLSLPQHSSHFIKSNLPEHWPTCGTRLKYVEIKYLSDTDEDVEMIKYILSCGKVLELLSVDVYLDRQCYSKGEAIWREHELCEKLFHLENPSACEIKFIAQFVNSSNKSFIPRRRSIRLAKYKVV
uniref:F-box domain-containing protein n=1 Tax=Chenopodium quinoa TaxID=63459 RepID=A0A803MWF3_CHEQI